MFGRLRTCAAATLVGLSLLAAGCGEESGSDGSAVAGGSDKAVGPEGVVGLHDGGSVKVALVPGGPHPYFQPWKEYGGRAKADFGLGEVTFNETAEWDQGKQNSVLDALAVQGHNAAGIFGVSPTDINSTFADLKGKGLAVGSLGSCPAGDTDDADFCLSTDVELAARKAAEAAIDAMGGEGTLVHLTGLNVDSNTQRRKKGVDEAVGAAQGKVELLQTIADIDKDLQTAQKAVSDLLAAHGRDIDAIVTTAYNPAVAAAQAVKKSGLPIKVVAIDDDKTILAGIRDGSVTGTVAQNAAGQAYVGSWALALLASGQCKMRQPGTIVDSGSFVVTRKNVDTYVQERDAKNEALMKQFSSELLTCS
jgi:ribose transport system substrate-binding protein